MTILDQIMRERRADAAAAREESARAERKAEAVPMPDAVRERMGKMFGGRDLGGGK